MDRQTDGLTNTRRRIACQNNTSCGHFCDIPSFWHIRPGKKTGRLPNSFRPFVRVVQLFSQTVHGIAPLSSAELHTEYRGWDVQGCVSSWRVCTMTLSSCNTMTLFPLPVIQWYWASLHLPSSRWMSLCITSALHLCLVAFTITSPDWQHGKLSAQFQ